MDTKTNKCTIDNLVVPKEVAKSLKQDQGRYTETDEMISIKNVLMHQTQASMSSKNKFKDDRRDQNRSGQNSSSRGKNKPSRANPRKIKAWSHANGERDDSLVAESGWEHLGKEIGIGRKIRTFSGKRKKLIRSINSDHFLASLRAHSNLENRSRQHGASRASLLQVRKRRKEMDSAAEDDWNYSEQRGSQQRSGHQRQTEGPDGSKNSVSLLRPFGHNKKNQIFTFQGSCTNANQKRKNHSEALKERFDNTTSKDFRVHEFPSENEDQIGEGNISTHRLGGGEFTDKLTEKIKNLRILQRKTKNRLDKNKKKKKRIRRDREVGSQASKRKNEAKKGGNVAKKDDVARKVESEGKGVEEESLVKESEVKKNESRMLLEPPNADNLLGGMRGRALAQSFDFGANKLKKKNMVANKNKINRSNQYKKSEKTESTGKRSEISENFTKRTEVDIFGMRVLKKIKMKTDYNKSITSCTNSIKEFKFMRPKFLRSPTKLLGAKRTLIEQHLKNIRDKKKIIGKE